MTSALEQVSALPTTGQLSRAGLRDMLTRRTPLCLASSESLANFTVVDPATGVVPQFVIQNGTVYEYDSLDTTTVASAVCLVSGDATGRRYKTGGITAPWSVLSATTGAQPLTPSVGDRYLVPTAATGTDWSGKDGQVAIYSRAGWQFATVPIGRGLYAEDTNIRYYRNAAGTWTSGFGAVQVGANGINITNVLGANASFVVKVENQTTTTAPSSPTAFVAYIVGGTGGAWSGYSVGDVAMCLSDGTWTRIVPTRGDEVFDKNLNYVVAWNGTAWESAAGVWVDYPDPVKTQSGSVSAVSGSFYTYSASVAPTNGLSNTRDDATQTIGARRVGSKLLFDYEAFIEGAALDESITVALHVVEQSAALAWKRTPPYVKFSPVIEATNTDEVEYEIRLYPSGSVSWTGYLGRQFTVQGGA